MKNQSNQKGMDIKKNPSRDYESDTKSFGSDVGGRTEVNPSRLGNQSEVDLNRSGVNGVNESSSQNDAGYSAPSASQKESQQQQKQSAAAKPMASANYGAGQKQQAQQQPKKGYTSQNTDLNDDDLDEEETSLAGSDEDTSDMDEGIDTGITGVQRNQTGPSSANI